MLDDNRRDAALRDQIPNVLKEVKRLLRGKARAGLVHQQKLRSADQRQRHVDSALHAVCNSPGFLVEDIVEVHDLDHVPNPVVTETPGDKRKLLADGKILKYVGALEGPRHAVASPPRD